MLQITMLGCKTVTILFYLLFNFGLEKNNTRITRLFQQTVDAFCYLFLESIQQPWCTTVLIRQTKTFYQNRVIL